MRFLDWFAGIGGFRYGLEKANQKGWQSRKRTRGSGCSRPQWYSTNSERDARQGDKDFVCVGACEADKYARRVYARNFGHEPEWGDSRAVDPFELPEFDLFCAGFPCPSFSIAGKRHGFSDPRGTLFFEIVRICREKRPSYLLLENVKGLLSVDSGFAFETILSSLSEIGYDCQWEVLNSKRFGVPQNRERVFIIGHLRGIHRPQVFPLGEVGEEAACVAGEAEKRGQGLGSSELGSECEPMPQRWPLRYLDRNQRNIEGNYGFTLDGSQTWGTREGMRIRHLTPLECERLQGFPDGWTEGESDTQRYKMLGNAVTVNVITAIGEAFLEAMEEV